MMLTDINNITILSTHGIDYRYITFGITGIEATNSLRNADFSEKSGSL